MSHKSLAGDLQIKDEKKNSPLKPPRKQPTEEAVTSEPTYPLLTPYTNTLSPIPIPTREDFLGLEKKEPSLKSATMESTEEAVISEPIDPLTPYTETLSPKIPVPALEDFLGLTPGTGFPAFTGPTPKPQSLHKSSRGLAAIQRLFIGERSANPCCSGW